MKEPLSWLQSPEGWDGLNAQATEGEERADVKALLAEFEVAKLFHAVFVGGRGPELLAHLRERLFRTPIYSINAIGFNELQMPLTPDQWCWMRVGQNSVLHHVEAMIDKAIDGPPVATQGEIDGEESRN